MNNAGWDSVRNASPCTTMTPVIHGAYGTAGAPDESGRKNLFGFFACLALGKGG
jgi:hypothetical protein